MPELPECEANRRRVEEAALNRTIKDVTVTGAKSLELPSPAERDRLKGRQFTEARRHGKAIFAGSASGPWLAVHLGMTGSLRPFDEADGPPDYAKFVIVFEGDRRLAFRCPRKLGSVHVIDDPDAYIEESGLGPDALQIGRQAFTERVCGSRAAIKSALTDQKKVAGIGNLWSDEILFQAGIAPDTRADALGEEQAGRLYDAMREVLGRIVDLDADYARIPGDWLVSSREEGAECPLCGGTITKKTVGGRSAYFCAGHQNGAG